MSKTEEILKLLKEIKSLKPDDLDQKELHEIHEKEKVKDKYGRHYNHPLIEPTSCPSCGNYRLDFGGLVYECPQKRSCQSEWDNKLCLCNRHKISRFK